MNRTIEFKNFEQNGELISGDLYIQDKFIVRLTDNLTNIINSDYTDIGLYEYFRKAVLIYVQQYKNMNKSYFTASNNVIH